MASRWTWFPTGDPSLCPNFGENFVSCWERLSVCPQGFIPRAMARPREPTKIWKGCCDVWSPRILPLGANKLPMVEYAHNALPVSSTGLSPFECSLGYQPPIFPSLESEVAVPSAHAFVQRCRRTWTRARETLLQVGARTKAKADRHRSKPPVYVVGQKVWLSTKNIPLRSVSNKLAPKFIGPFTVTRSLVRWQSASTFLQCTGGFIPSFMYLKLNLCFILLLIRQPRFPPRRDS